MPVPLLKEFFPARRRSGDEQRPLTAKNRGQGFDSVLGGGIHPTSRNSVNACPTLFFSLRLLWRVQDYASVPVSGA